MTLNEQATELSQKLAAIKEQIAALQKQEGQLYNAQLGVLRAIGRETAAREAAAPHKVQECIGRNHHGEMPTNI